MTAEGYRVLDDQLKQLKSVERPSVIAAISEARATGRAAALAPAIEGAETEIARWEAARDETAYALMLVQPE